MAEGRSRPIHAILRMSWTTPAISHARSASNNPYVTEVQVMDACGGFLPFPTFLLRRNAGYLEVIEYPSRRNRIFPQDQTPIRHDQWTSHVR